MAPRTPTGDHVGDDEDAPLLRSRTSARPNAAVWMSVSMVVAGALVLAMGAAPRAREVHWACGYPAAAALRCKDEAVGVQTSRVSLCWRRAVIKRHQDGRGRDFLGGSNIPRKSSVKIKHQQKEFVRSRNRQRST
jgi:hypothetical protein